MHSYRSAAGRMLSHPVFQDRSDRFCPQRRVPPHRPQRLPGCQGAADPGKSWRGIPVFLRPSFPLTASRFFPDPSVMHPRTVCFCLPETPSFLSFSKNLPMILSHEIVCRFSIYCYPFTMFHISHYCRCILKHGLTFNNIRPCFCAAFRSTAKPYVFALLTLHQQVW